MAGKREEKREDLKARLIEAARNRISADGLANLRARDVTQDAGCALGGLYTVFADLDELIIHVNSGTLKALEASLTLQEVKDRTPTDRMRNLAKGYLAFAVHHRHLWKALFDHRPAEGQPSPEWHLQEHMFLMDVIAEPLAELQPSLSAEDRASRARTLFGAVHGVITISLEARFVGVPMERLERELDEFVQTIAAGSKARQAE
ncbi:MULTISPECIES: TetR/AcrR family transcriptional regulator [unclassified Rhizobium]|uniref:TetR/AcrR family transcriptional regulator n=1 Tax=unclassified Rhizobium TaxID=2613769 RepID=UPI000715C729|nr:MULTISPECIES: TetR/AcrR family transcriptional regulator [unclassified Rhizobium]KQS88135.1 TetR family transcriptional regulator [Rhizobium sp. Leaf391]KQT00631.1 TetR family transcriptional regulator [Rhizobium sp. Leaf386]KQU09104.1 TetR family transcriptional regulator [Rhizobium sp. Leaf453]